MADSLARAQLARAANALRRAAQSPLPALLLLTDDDHLPDPQAAVAALPRGSLVVLRSREKRRRVTLAKLLQQMAPPRGLIWIVANDPALAASLDATGAHFPERSISLAANWRIRRPGWLITCAAHSLRACFRARCAGANAVLLSPVFPTASHPGVTGFGGLRARIIARAAGLPVYGLGGVDALTARALSAAPLAGLAAIRGLAVHNQDSNRCADNTANV